MNLSRRNMLASAAALGGSLALPAGAAATNRADRGGLLEIDRNPADHKGPLMSRARAFEVLDAAGLEALVVWHPISILHATGFDVPLLPVQVARHDGVYAIVPRDPKRRVTLVMPSFWYYWAYANLHDESQVKVYQYTHPTDNNSILATGEPVPEAEYMFPDMEQEPMDAMEAERARAVAREAAAHGVTSSVELSLSRALEDERLSDKRLGIEEYDHDTHRRLLSSVVPKASVRPAAQECARIRMVKSEIEVGMMRHAARANAEAALVACQAVRAGASYRDLRVTFYKEAAKRGNQGLWLIVDRMSSDLFEAEFHEGQAFLIDAVSSYSGYFGDYGRTVFVGEPSRHMKRHTDAIAFAWNAIAEQLKPGVTFDDIRRMGTEAVRKGGFDTPVRFTPHSIGLIHTDALRLGNLTLEKNMIISVDCPVMGAGIGGSAHLEDLALITENGCEIINDTGDQTITV